MMSEPRDPQAEIDRLKARLARERQKREQIEMFAEQKTRELFAEKEKFELMSQVIGATSRISDLIEASEAAGNILLDFGKTDLCCVVRNQAEGLEIVTRQGRDQLGSIGDDELISHLAPMAQLRPDEDEVEATIEQSGQTVVHRIKRISSTEPYYLVLTFFSRQKYLRLEHGIVLYVANQLRLVLEKQASDAKIHNMSHYDQLTQLCSKEVFLDNLRQQVAHTSRNNRYAVVALDVAEMGVINSEYSMEFGDRLLKHVAREIALLLRHQDSVTRSSGNCFAFYLVSDQIDTALDKVLERIRLRFREPINWEGNSITIHMHCGYSVNQPGATDAEQALQFAKTALKEAKQKRNFDAVQFEHSMLDSASNRFKLETKLRNALSNNEFRLFYQPIIDLKTDEVVNAEALLRWFPDPPDGQMVSPAEFIPLLELTDLILPVGRWLIRQALEDYASWKRMGLPIRQVSVNVSPRQFYDVSLMQFIDQTLQSLGLPNRCLNVEITESLYLEPNNFIDEMLAKLKAMGIEISLDDFGTGYSSLSYLNRYPVQKLKIDRAFVNELDDGDGDIPLLRSIIALSKSMNLASVAEGIETGTSAATLKTLGVNYGQGFYYSRPLPFEAFTDYLRSYRPGAEVPPQAASAR